MPENNDFLPQVMQRYAIAPPMSDSDVNPQFMAALLRAFEEKPFCAGDFGPFSIELIVDYIKRTHVFYLQKKLPEIEQSILLLSGLYTSHHPILTALQSFFHRYCQDLTNHIQAEETKLLPHIALMHRAANEAGHFSEYILACQEYSISRFLSDHHDTEDELRDIRDTIRLYEPPTINASLYRILLAQLQAFEQDLCVHAHIEDEVLIPKALQMESILHDQLNKTAKLN
ncbi:MAG TPA: hemerythrin domain-containing protein [Puia sp.]|nr:hemerythrin domain-containing protein [Puia sp.]